MTQDICLETELQRLFTLTEALKRCSSDRERIETLDRQPRVLQWLENPSWLKTFSERTSPEFELILKSMVAIGQEDHLAPRDEESSLFAEKLRAMLEDLVPVEAFYKEMGGIIGYHSTMFSFLCPEGQMSKEMQPGFYHRPPGIDISTEDKFVRDYILEGILSLPLLAEIYPVGGAADRLKLCDPLSGLPLPAAKLQFCGYTLLERLLRDVQAREYLYYRLFGEQTTTPIAMMTSSEKDNHRHILELCETSHYFGRPKDSFRIFCQPIVPTMDRRGKWCWSGRLKLLMKPGGHGVMWKVAKEEGIFDWFESLGCKKVLVRQINNPIAGIDYGLIAFCGAGFREEKVFGFASCPRQVESAEGVNILIERRMSGESRYCLTNIEYCDFPKFSIEDIPVAKGSPYSQYPSNTNILFADISAVKETVALCPIPGMLVNLKMMSFVDEEGNVREQEVARLESTMQNLADCFEQTADPSSNDIVLKTYLTYNHRRKTISTTKKLFQGALLMDSAGISAEGKASDAAVFDDSIAEGSMEETAKTLRRSGGPSQCKAGERSEPAARRENAADGCLTAGRKPVQSMSKALQGGDSLLETPEGCLYDILCNAHDLLTQYCQITVPKIPTMDLYIQQGPPFLFSYHPALGPLFSIIGQKLRGGSFNLHSELNLEIVEVDIENLQLSGSLHITADRVMGKTGEDGILKYSERVGCVRLRNVVVDNRGFDPTANNAYWKGEIIRHELCEIQIRGNGEFVAEDIALRGKMQIEVPDGFRVTAFEDAGELKFKKEALSGVDKRWIYHLDDDGSIFLSQSNG